MLDQLLSAFDQQACVYYFDLSFEETLRRHQTKDPAADFGVAELGAWWNQGDYLGTQGEVMLTAEQSQSEIVELILGDLANLKSST